MPLLGDTEYFLIKTRQYYFQNKTLEYELPSIISPAFGPVTILGLRAQ